METSIYASHTDVRDLSVKWHARYVGHVEGVNGVHPERRRYRPKSTIECDGEGWWAVFWEVAGLERLAEPIPIAELCAYGTGEPCGKGFVPEGPMRVGVRTGVVAVVSRAGRSSMLGPMLSRPRAVAHSQRRLMRAESPVVPVPLYHGTSTIFLRSILEHGLGGRNPIQDLKVLDFVREIRPLVERHLTDTQAFQIRGQSFGLMVDQHCGGLNFQHGDAYVTGSLDRAVQYASQNRYGSEILSYALDFLQLLVDRDVPTVRDSIYRKYRPIFQMLQVNAAPLIIRAEGVSKADLLDDKDNDADHELRLLETLVATSSDGLSDDFQVDFRLTRPITAENLDVYLLSVTGFDPFYPKYDLWELPRQPNGM